MIGIWGSAERQIAALEMTIYLTLGALVSLLGIVALYLAGGEGANLNMIELAAHLAENPISPNPRKLSLAYFSLGLVYWSPFSRPTVGLLADMEALQPVTQCFTLVY